MHAGLLLPWIRPAVERICNRELWELVRDQWPHLGVRNEFDIHGECCQVCKLFVVFLTREVVMR